MMDLDWPEPVSYQDESEAEIDLSGLLDYMADTGSLNLVLGPPKRGKTAIMVLLSEYFHSQGKLIAHNLPMRSNLPGITPALSLGQLTRTIATRQPGQEYVIMIDEAGLRVGGMSPVAGRENMKWWFMNVMRKVGGACAFMALQDESMGAPLFRDSEVMRGQIKKVWKREALIDFPNLRDNDPFPIPRSRLPLKVRDIPLPSIQWDSEGPAPFNASDFKVQDLDDYISTHSEGRISGQAHRELVLEFLDKAKPGKRQVSKSERLRQVLEWAGDDADKLDNAQLAIITGLTPGSLKVQKSRIKSNEKKD